ncbi:beta-ketoacyl synthase N-terminal-like domain-containing protein [Amycolatopsis sp. cg5]|uniref:beta-ketoacyl synthase N-terminal-like domain-containing protein n=1 Tax=Amycolatopsis sp. cg5 TaxID=3238802 RepID=UPI0035250110
MAEVVITGTGVISAAGRGVAPLLDAMDSGRPLFGGASALPWPVAGVQPGDIPWPDGDLWVNNRKYANTAAQAAVAAAQLALYQAGRAEDESSALRSGTVMAVGSSGSDELGEAIPRLAALHQTDPRPLTKLLYDEVPDYSYIKGIPSQLGQFVSMASGFRGSNVAVYGEAGAGGLGALALGLRMIESGELDRVLVVGVAPAMSGAMLVAFDRQEPFGTEAEPGRGPFDLDRAGALLGQGTAAIMIERASVAKSEPLAQLLSCETVCAPTRRSALEAVVELALEEGKRQPALWWAHGSGSQAQDFDECQVVGPRVTSPVTSSKGTIGHAFESGGLIDVALAVESLRRESAPPIGLLKKPDPALGAVDFVVDRPRKLPPSGSALITALNHGGDSTTAGAAMIAREDKR